MRSCKINFHAIFNTSFGQEVFICGNHPELGSWDPSKALKLFTDKKTYPKWKSIKKIQISQGYVLEFKLCVFQRNQFLRWQKFPINLNRTFKLNCRGITLLIIQNSVSLIQEKRFNYYSSTEISPVQVRKFSSFFQDEFQTEQFSESSSSNSTDYQEKASDSSIEKINEPNIRSLISTFRYIISEGLFGSKSKMTRLAGFQNDHSEDAQSNKKNNIIYLFNLPDKNSLSRQEQLKNNQLLFFNITRQNWQKGSQNVCQKLEKVAAKCSSFLQSTLFLEGIQFALIPKLLNYKFYNPMGLKYILRINNLKFMKQQIVDFNNLLIIEGILLVDGLIFADFKIFQEFMSLMQSQQIPLSIREVDHSLKILQTQQKNIYYKIQDNENDNQDIIKLIKTTEKRSKYNIDQILREYEQCKNKKIFFFSFGKYQDFSFLINNRQILLKLSSEVLIYVFTPNQLSFFTDFIQLFPKIVFVCYTYLEIAYNREVFSLSSSSLTEISLSEIIDEINEELSGFPNVKLTIDRNVINIKQIVNSNCAGTLDILYHQINDLVTNFNEITNQNLIINFINQTTLEIKHIYQTEIFFSNLIFKNSETPVDFVHLTVVDRLSDCRFLDSLNELFLQKKSYYFENTKFFSSQVKINSIASIKHKEVGEQQISQLLMDLFKCHSQSYYHKLKMANAKIMQKIRFEM